HIKEFQDKRVRQAIANAINRKAIVDAFYGGLGLVPRERQPPALWGYNPDIKDHAYDPKKAQDLLKQAGFPNGFSDITWEGGKKEPPVFWELPVTRADYHNPNGVRAAVAADLAKVGIKSKLQTVEWANYIDNTKKGVMPLYM